MTLLYSIYSDEETVFTVCLIFVTAAEDRARRPQVGGAQRRAMGENMENEGVLTTPVKAPRRGPKMTPPSQRSTRRAGARIKETNRLSPVAEERKRECPESHMQAVPRKKLKKEPTTSILVQKKAMELFAATVPKEHIEERVSSSNIKVCTLTPFLVSFALHPWSWRALPFTRRPNCVPF